MTAAPLFERPGLLFWGAHSPAVRRGILPLTIFPVIAGFAAAAFLGWKEAYISTAGAVHVWTMQVFLSTLFVYASLSAGRHRRPGGTDVSSCKAICSGSMLSIM